MAPYERFRKEIIPEISVDEVCTTRKAFFLLQIAALPQQPFWKTLNLIFRSCYLWVTNSNNVTTNMAAYWDYSGLYGEDTWKQHFYVGLRQSPINILTRDVVRNNSLCESLLKFDGTVTNYSCENKGNNVSFTPIYEKVKTNTKYSNYVFLGGVWIKGCLFGRKYYIMLNQWLGWFINPRRFLNI